MERINQILRNKEYKRNLNKIEELEMNRVYCLHNLQHFMDVARISYIIALERGYKVSKEIIYATALLHDIGRWREYIDGKDHSIVGAEIARDILKDCGFSKEEINMILEAIKKHRKGEGLKTELDFVIYEGDKKSRLCIYCTSIEKCKRFANKEKAIVYY